MQVGTIDPLVSKLAFSDDDDVATDTSANFQVAHSLQNLWLDTIR